MDKLHAYHVNPSGHIITRPLSSPLKHGWRIATDDDHTLAAEVHAARLAVEVELAADAPTADDLALAEANAGVVAENDHVAAQLIAEDALAAGGPVKP